MDVRGIEAQVTKLSEPVAAEMGLSLLDVEMAYEGSEWFLRLYIEKETGVGIEDCAKFSTAIDTLLDSTDPIPEAYVLEVTSSGEKPLRFIGEYARFAGRIVMIHTYKQIEGSKRHQGKLVGIIDGAAVIVVEDKEVRIPFEMISKARLAVEF
jgi:ribosome maturation factor RimP